MRWASVDGIIFVARKAVPNEIEIPAEKVSTVLAAWLA
jgi:hypothetical protein